jgi:hypothetical protein
MRLSVVVLVTALLACGKKTSSGTFDLDAGGPFVEARAIRAIQKEPVLAIHNISKKDGPPHFVWGYDFRRWGWGEASLTHLSHSGPEIWKFTLAEPIQRPCDAAFLGDRLVPINATSWRLEGGPLAGELVRRAPGERCAFEIASQSWAERDHWALR